MDYYLFYLFKLPGRFNYSFRGGAKLLLSQSKLRYSSPTIYLALVPSSLGHNDHFEGETPGTFRIQAAAVNCESVDLSKPISNYSSRVNQFQFKGAKKPARLIVVSIK